MRIVGERGAQAVRGSLDDVASLTDAALGCAVVIHVAALFKLWGAPVEFERTNVQGTANLLQAAAAASVRRFVQVGAAAVVMGDPAPMLRADESLPRQERAWAAYSASKARSEALVLGANRSGAFETVVIRPPMIWGAGMPMLDHMIQTVRAGQFRWVGDGSQAMSTAHVDNVCHAVELAVEQAAAARPTSSATVPTARSGSSSPAYCRRAPWTRPALRCRCRWPGPWPARWSGSGGPSRVGASRRLRARCCA